MKPQLSGVPYAGNRTDRLTISMMAVVTGQRSASEMAQSRGSSALEHGKDAMTAIPDNPETAPDHGWRHSSYSTGAASACVEVARAEKLVRVRDSKNITAPALVFTSAEWHVFVAGVHGGEFDVGPVT
jgi:hypothetical protein